MVEFALIFTALFTLVVGVIYLGLYINYQADETHLAAEGARYAAVGQVPTGCSSSLSACIASQAYGELGTGSSDVTKVSVSVCTGPGGAGAVGDPVTVKVASSYKIVPIFNLTIPDTESATMRLEAPSSAPAC